MCAVPGSDARLGPMTPLRAVFLDIGDTVLRANPSWEGVYTLALEEYGVKVAPDALRDALRNTYHHGGYGFDQGFEATQETSFRRAGRDGPAGAGVAGHGSDAGRVLQPAFGAVHAGQQLARLPRRPADLEALRSRGLIVGAVSNWLWQLPELLHSLELVAHFDFVAASARVGYEKPHPEIFRYALREAGVEPAEGLHVGDHLDADVSGAQAVGISAGADRSPGAVHGGRPAGGVPLIRSLAELLPIVDARLQRASA